MAATNTPFWTGALSPGFLTNVVKDLSTEFSTTDGATLLSIAYMLQEHGRIHDPTNGEDVEEDHQFVLDHLDSHRWTLTRLLLAAGCKETADGNWTG